MLNVKRKRRGKVSTLHRCSSDKKIKISVDIIFPTAFIVHVMVKLPKCVSTFLFSGFRRFVIGKAPVCSWRHDADVYDCPPRAGLPES
jgi:hypothetical protein